MADGPDDDAQHLRFAPATTEYAVSQKIKSEVTGGRHAHAIWCARSSESLSPSCSVVSSLEQVRSGRRPSRLCIHDRGTWAEDRHQRGDLSAGTRSRLPRSHFRGVTVSGIKGSGSGTEQAVGWWEITLDVANDAGREIGPWYRDADGRTVPATIRSDPRSHHLRSQDRAAHSRFSTVELPIGCC